MRRVIAAGLAIFAMAGGAGATEVEIRNVRSQTLPPEIGLAYVQPGGGGVKERVWLVAADSPGLTDGQIEAEIEGQWKKDVCVLGRRNICEYASSLRPCIRPVFAAICPIGVFRA